MEYTTGHKNCSLIENEVFKSLVDQQAFSDITIEVEGHEIKAHRLVLAGLLNVKF
jgi:hypothetical protein